MPSWCSAFTLFSMPFSTRSRVICRHASASDTWRVRKKIFNPLMVNIVISSRAPVWSANISVWPMNGIFAAFSDSLLIGVVATPATRPGHRQLDRGADRGDRPPRRPAPAPCPSAARRDRRLSWCSTSITPARSAIASGPAMRFSVADRPQTASARSNTRASPMRKLREMSRTSGESSARTAISGPMPAGSPMVTARMGLARSCRCLSPVSFATRRFIAHCRAKHRPGGNAMLRIHGSARSRAVRTLWMAEELGIAVRAHRPSRRVRRGTRTPEYLALNPNAPRADDRGRRVRAVGIDGDQPVSREEARQAVSGRPEERGAGLAVELLGGRSAGPAD